MDLESNTAFVQDIGTFDDPSDPAQITMDTVVDPVEVPAPVVRMVVREYLSADDMDIHAEIQLSFTRDQMRQHIVQCQKVMGSLPA